MSERVTRQYAEVLLTGDGLERVSRQYAEVLLTGDGLARVSRQYIEILGEYADITDAIALPLMTLTI